MNQQIASKRRCSTWYRWVFIVPCLIVLLAISIVVPFLWMETSAAKQLSLAIQKASLEGIPYDNASAQARFREQTHLEGAAVWSELLVVSSSESITSQIAQLDGTSDNPITKAIKDSETRSEYDQMLDKLIRDTRPLLDLIENESHVAGPIRLPFVFWGLETGLQNVVDSHHVCTLLSLRCEYELMSGNRERSIPSLATLHRCLNLFDWKIGSVAAVYLQLPSRQRFYQLVGQTLRDDHWSEEDLAEINRMLEPIPIADSWRDLIDMDRAMMQEVDKVSYSSLEDRLTMRWLYRPTHRFHDWNIAQSVRSMGELGFEKLLTGVPALKFDETQPVNLMYYWKILGVEFAKLESHRRLVRTALQLRQYRLKHGSWPIELGSLDRENSISSPPTLHQNCAGIEFRYEYQEGLPSRLISDFGDIQYYNLKSSVPPYSEKYNRIEIELKP